MRTYAVACTASAALVLAMLVGCGGPSTEGQSAESQSDEQSVTITSKSQVSGSSAPSVGGRSTSWSSKCKKQADSTIETLQLTADSYLDGIESKKFATTQEYWDEYDAHLGRMKSTVSSLQSSYDAYVNMGCDSYTTETYLKKVNEKLDELSREMSDVTERKVSEDIGGMPKVEKPKDEKDGKGGESSASGSDATGLTGSDAAARDATTDGSSGTNSTGGTSSVGGTGGTSGTGSASSSSFSGVTGYDESYGYGSDYGDSYGYDYGTTTGESYEYGVI